MYSCNEPAPFPDFSRSKKFRMAWQIYHGLAPLVLWCRGIKDRGCSGQLNMKIVGIGDFDSSIESFWRTECNAKTSALCKVPFMKKIKKTWPKWSKMVKNDRFSRFFLFFQE